MNYPPKSHPPSPPRRVTTPRTAGAWLWGVGTAFTAGSYKLTIPRAVTRSINYGPSLCRRVSRALARGPSAVKICQRDTMCMHAEHLSCPLWVFGFCLRAQYTVKNSQQGPIVRCPKLCASLVCLAPDSGMHAERPRLRQSQLLSQSGLDPVRGLGFRCRPPTQQRKLWRLFLR